MKIEIYCTHCGTYPVTEADRLFDLSLTTLVRGVQCFNCDDEAYALVDGERVTIYELRAAAQRALDNPPDPEFYDYATGQGRR